MSKAPEIMFLGANAFRAHAQRVVSIGTHCVEPPIGCGSPLHAIPFTDEDSVREYRLTGMCQECQDKFYAEFEEE